MDNNEIVAKRNEEKGKEDFKRLAVLLEGKEFSEFLERVSEIRKRADKLYAAGRAKQAAMREAVAREKERERGGRACGKSKRRVRSARVERL